MIAIVAVTLHVWGSSSKAEAANGESSAPKACSLLSNTKASYLLRSVASGQAFTDLGFPVLANAEQDPTYSQCRFTATSSRSQIRVIVNASPATSPPVRIRAASPGLNLVAGFLR